jgi:hypothetical protein
MSSGVLEHLARVVKQMISSRGFCSRDFWSKLAAGPEPEKLNIYVAHLCRPLTQLSNPGILKWQQLKIPEWDVLQKWMRSYGTFLFHNTL